MRDLLTSQGQACWREHIQKEAAARVAWNMRYGHKYLKEGTRTRARKQPLQAPVRAALGTSLALATSSPLSKQEQVGRPDIPRVQDQLPREPGAQGLPRKGDRVGQARGAPHGPAEQSRPEGLEMRQVPPSTRKLLYQGISHEGQGRALYLRERCQQTPGEKFRYPILSSWEYGWHVGDAMKDSRSPTYRKIQPIAKVFFFKSGVFHFPRRTDQLL